MDKDLVKLMAAEEVILLDADTHHLFKLDRKQRGGNGLAYSHASLLTRLSFYQVKLIYIGKKKYKEENASRAAKHIF